MNSIIWKQADSRWGRKPYPTRDCTMSGAGCGCVSCTHIAMEQDRYAGWTPENLRPWMVSQGFAIRNQGTTYSGMTRTLQHIGHTNVVVVGTADPMSKVWNECNKGNRIGIILFRGGSYNGVRWTNSGHYVAFTDYKVSNGKHYFFCKDSGGRGHDGWYSFENSMRGLVYMVWIVERINPMGKLVIDGSGGTATVKRLQQFLGVTKSGTITVSKSNHAYNEALIAVKIGEGADPTVKAMQRWLGIKQDGYWGKATSTAIQKRLNITADGYFGQKSMSSLQRYLNMRDKAVYPTATPTSTAKPVQQTKQDKMCAWAKSICASGKYHYKVYTDDPDTHKCPICHPNTGNGWNCIGYAVATWRHGGGIPCRCSCEVINNSMGEKMLRSDHATATQLAKDCLGITQIQVISNGGKAIPASSLKKGDLILYFEGSTYTHLALYIGNGQITDSSRAHSPQVKYGVPYVYPDYGVCKLAIRYTGK